MQVRNVGCCNDPHACKYSHRLSCTFEGIFQCDTETKTVTYRSFAGSVLEEPFMWRILKELAILLSDALADLLVFKATTIEMLVKM